VQVTLALRHGAPAVGRPSHRVGGRLTRTDIREPPTVGRVRLGDGRLRLAGRSVNKQCRVHERSADGAWSPEKAFGATSLSSGPALAASAAWS
jgi:hypothetical protein